MRIERISDKQIRCTLSKRDLIERQLKISELAYGSERAKALFRDMMEQANIDFGFEVEDIPLMIEAIPTSRESLVLVITKVDNPQEFDEKFANFNLPGEVVVNDEEPGYTDDNALPANADSFTFDDLLECFDQLYEKTLASGADEEDRESRFIPLSEALQNLGDKKPSKQKRAENIHERVKVFSFMSMNPIIEAAHRVTPAYTGKNTVWKDVVGKKYYLLLNRGSGKHAFHSVCSTISEYGSEEPVTYATQDYFNEHFRLIIRDKALSQLAKL